MGTNLVKKLDILVLILLPIIAVLGSLYFRADYLFSTILFFGPPSLYLSLRTPKAILRTLVFALIASLFSVFIFDLLGHLTETWWVTKTIFPFRFFGVVPPEDLAWAFLYIYSLVIFYEHFLDKGRHNLLDKRMKYFVVFGLTGVGLILVGLLSGADFTSLPIPYSGLGLVFLLLPLVLFLTHFVKFISKYVKVAVYFSSLSLLNEITALQLGHWEFPGKNYLGWIELAGVRFPFEEFFFYILIGAVGILTYFEYFDDSKHTK